MRNLHLRTYICSTASLLALCLPTQGVYAQDSGAPSFDASEIIVTGSRIVRDGYDSPTPVSVLSTADIQTQAPTNLADFVNQMPAIAGSSTPATSGNSISGGTAGINALNLRQLGTSRTLVLLDGQRSVASAATGVVDVNTFPQDLVQRVEIVTGGASAAYGSDAVGGVVNFILDKDFRGLKLNSEYGITNYGDGTNYRLSGSAGIGLLENRMSILLNVEYSRTPGIHWVDRKWNDKGYFQINNPRYTPTNGEPERYIGTGIGPAQVSPGGLITAGPLKGTYFSTINPATGKATTGQLAYGEALGPWMIGGDYEYTSQNYRGSTSLQPEENRLGTFGRVSFAVSPNFELFGQFSYNRSSGLNYYIQSTNIANLTIRADNAFLPDSVRQELADRGLSSFQMGTTNYGVPRGGSGNVRNVYRSVVGANGNFELLNNDWNWDFYYQRGVAKVREQTVGVWNNARMAMATDAVVAQAGNAAGIAAGTIVCRSTLSNPGNGCVPLNRIGMGGVTQEALNYIFTDEQPYRDQTLTQDVAALAFNGNDLLSLPGGSLAIAFGGEWRQEKINGFVKPEYNSGWLYGNYLVNKGKYNVTEGFVEILAPLFDGFELNAAGRFTHYSTSGDVQTWKVGATYSPIPDIRLRGTISRDIRAPNLDELFAAGTARSNSVIIEGAAHAFVLNMTGNPDLKPEKADSWSVGTVLSPTFLPGFNFAVDYWDIKVTDAIGALHQQEVADLCYEQNVQAQCDNMIWAPVNGVPSLQTIRVRPFNFATQRARGIDFETSYHFDLGQIIPSAPGQVMLRGVATHYIENVTDRGIGFPQDIAGTNNWFGGALPSWLYRVSMSYRADPVTFSLTGRGVSGGKYDNRFIECQANCPPSTPEHITINKNRIAGAFYLDSSIAYGFDTGLGDGSGEIQLSIRNLLNTDPVPLANGPGGQNAVPNPQAPRTFYDVLGRVYRVAARFKF